MKRIAIFSLVLGLLAALYFWSEQAPKDEGVKTPPVAVTPTSPPPLASQPSQRSILKEKGGAESSSQIITSVSTFDLLPESGSASTSPTPQSTAVLIMVDTPEPSATDTPIERELLTPQEVAALSSSSDEPGNGGGGLGRRASPTPPQPNELLPTPSPSPSESPTPTPLPMVGGQARGYAMLYAMHPRARATVEQNIKTLIDARVLQIYLGILIDGTFNKDIPYIESILQRLAQAGRQITLSLYLSNGPTMRDYNTTPITIGFNRIDPIEFRSLIKYDPSLRSRYITTAQSVRSLFDLNSSLGDLNRNIAIPMLEDNLDRDSYGAMRTLASSALGSSVQFMRNPCVGCYEGNDSDSLGDPIESHIWNDLPLMPPGSGFTLDGTGISYPSSDPAANERSDALLLMSRIAYERRLAFFGLWRGDWQGRYPGESSPPHPDERVYGISTPEEMEFEISVLREGLIQIVE